MKQSGWLMKHERGFTLVELMTVISIVVLLLAWGIPAYSTWKVRHDIENEIVQLYSDLQFGRMTAYGDKVITGILWGAGQNSTNFTSYKIMSDTNNTGTIDSSATQVQGTSTVNLKYPITTADQQSVSFDPRGYLYIGYTSITPDTANPITFTVNSALSAQAALNCVNVTTNRIILGKINVGTGVCQPK
jgi:prepilin-type N-terminal cleavage/methylation domain-containing protein